VEDREYQPALSPVHLLWYRLDACLFHHVWFDKRKIHKNWNCLEPVITAKTFLVLLDLHDIVGFIGET
jgi:hypothetical protein